MIASSTRGFAAHETDTPALVSLSESHAQDRDEKGLLRDGPPSCLLCERDGPAKPAKNNRGKDAGVMWWPLNAGDSCGTFTSRAHGTSQVGDEHLTEPVGDEPEGHTSAGGHDPDEPYRHDPAVAVMAARLVDSAFEAAARSWDVNECMRALAAQEGLDSDGLLGRELFQAASYRLRLDHGGKVGCALRSSPDTEHYAWPPRIGEVEPDVVALWRDVAGLVEHPAAIARFHDLLFGRRYGRRDEHAATAVQGYLAAARSRSRADLDVAAFLVRAWDLARSVGLWGLLADVQSELHSRAENAMSSGGAALPGVVLPMIAALAAPVPRGSPRRAFLTLPLSTCCWRRRSPRSGWASWRAR
ncbi:MAG: hypothetical protein QOG05_1322 [Streptosporangiaceae bacterium]|nr:hypothetical protein [Streptosporangiaceae bacterium]